MKQIKIDKKIKGKEAELAWLDSGDIICIERDQKHYIYKVMQVDENKIKLLGNYLGVFYMSANVFNRETVIFLGHESDLEFPEGHESKKYLYYIKDLQHKIKCETSCFTRLFKSGSDCFNYCEICGKTKQ